ncbi:MAG TPA: HlyD family efflux transporter periplasmic adaptor subunit [Hellea balneolensis]|uniref:HlyD family efflux transporter periplasmic adaptor subunit n=1 Tax=Hellea balneolensis TaxID=287478 RepID=A0A7C5R1J8_9PROT|nr:HlyD family efflux transporter periplasmic adaptor subunit [Hellea balneolensis]
MAYRYGCRVPTIGVAFLVMFPIMYTDTTDAYRLTSRRKRVMIDAAGMLVELTIACFALLAWSFLPEGAAKSAAFFIATTSWILSLTVNLNPLMRFDGYYLFSDALGQRNLQERGFALAKWKLREILFGLNHEIPIDVTKREKWILLVYAYCTWVYRFFLFLGIALLVHALFPKALGIILFSVEILFFIITPIFKEILIWWSLRMDILKSFKARINLVGLTAICIAMVLPLRTTIHAPALIRPSVSTDIYPKAAGLVTQIHVTPGAQVKSGQVLVTLSNDRLSYEITNTQLRAELLAAQLARRSSDKTDLADSTVLRQRLTRERAHLKGLRAEQDNLVIRAPHDGVFAQANPDLHIGRFISPSFPIASLIDSRTYEILELVPEKNVARIKEQSSARFIGSNWDGARLKARVHTIAPTAEERLNEPVFSSNYRGPIAVKPDQNGEDTPVEAVLRVLLTPEQTGAFNRAERGVVIFPATPESLAKAIWRHISHVFIREIDF